MTSLNRLFDPTLIPDLKDTKEIVIRSVPVSHREITRSQSKWDREDLADICLKDSASSMSNSNVGVNPTPNPTTTSSYEKETSVIFKMKTYGEEKKKKTLQLHKVKPSVYCLKLINYLKWREEKSYEKPAKYIPKKGKKKPYYDNNRRKEEAMDRYIYVHS
ncbi:unnamed protein product [Lepeophtheirus salmonis]|uniref:(salmon louse) hypothetical protein n=1 Tax=Lepeophtheirus salmonis TaxID=72036 RepID=A0A817FBE4_LEPSM|nr:unnamed protein product [Lepeophtheirus salmonis]CAG9477013.1 unnamed protein product [Lepeophtheirus salmonis]